MKRFLFASAAALTMLAAPAIAQMNQNQPMANQPMAQQDMEMNAQQKSMYDAMPANQRAMFDTWENDRKMDYMRLDAPVQSYYWTLQPDQQEAWWLLDDQQRTRLYSMAPEQRTAAWTSVVNQVNQMKNGQQPMARSGNMPSGSTATGSGNMASGSGMMAGTSGMAGAGNINFISNPVMQNIPAPHQGEYPLCNAGRQDNCINPREVEGRRR